MPWITQKHGPSRYRPPAVAIDETSIDEAINMKREWTRYHADLLGHQKELSRINRDAARFFSQESAEAMKHYRAFCFVISRIACNPPGDCRGIQANAEIAPYIDQAFLMLYIAWDVRQSITSDA